MLPYREKFKNEIINSVYTYPFANFFAIIIRIQDVFIRFLGVVDRE